MPGSEDTYEVLAKHYDSAYTAKDNLFDLPFYLELARASRGPVLEIGCGTGRILLAIAREGIEIHGVDSSPAMLGILQRKLEREPQEIRRRISIHAGDMRHVRLHRKFRLVMIPFRPLQHMHTFADQLAALRTAAFHVDDGGSFAFDVFFPRYDMLLSGIGEERFDMEWQVEGRPGTIIRRYYRKESIDKVNQNFTGKFLYRTFEGEQLVHEETSPLKMSWYTYPHLRALFLLAGLDPVEEYGSFAKAPLGNAAPEMIFILRKGGRNQP
jgi:SAM-dependent methyltransferase